MTGSAVRESFVAWLWERRALGSHYTSLDGQRVQVIYPGRRVGSWGPDFRGSLLAIDGRGNGRTKTRTFRRCRAPSYTG